MANTFTLTGGEYRRSIFSFGPVQKLSPGFLALIRKEADYQAKDAFKTGRHGGASCEHQLTQFKAVVKQQRTDIIGPLKEAQQADQQAYDNTLEARDNFNKEAQIEKHRVELSPAKAAETTKLETELETANQECHQTKQEVIDAEEKRMDYEEKHGPITVKDSFIRRYSWLLPAGIALADVGITSSAMISSGIPPVMALAGSLVLSGGLAYSSHAFGKDSHKKSRKGQAIWAAVCISILLFIGSIRMDAAFMLPALGVLGAFWLGGARVSYLNCKHKDSLAILRAEEKAKQKDKAAKTHRNTIVPKLKGLEGEYEKRACKLAGQDKTALDNKIQELSEAMARRNATISNLNDECDAEEEKGLAKIQAAFEKGRRQYYDGNNPPPAGPAQAAVIALFGLLLFTTSCKDSPITHTPETHCVARVDDGSYSREGSNYKETTASLCNYVKKTVGYTPGKYYADGIEFTVYHGIDHSIPRRTSTELEQGKPYAISIVPDRDSVVHQFFNFLLPATLDKVLAIHDTIWSTHLHRNTVHAFEQLNSCGAKHRTLLVLTDAIETGVINFSDYSPKDLQEQQDTIIQQLLKDTPLPDLNGIEVLLLLQPNPKLEALSYRAAQLFKTMWEQKGATVKVQHNL